MKLRGMAISMALVCATAASGWAETGPDRAARFFAEGTKLLQQADFNAALEALRQAAKADRSNDTYLQEYVLLRRITNMRRFVEEEPASVEWEMTARALHSFYHQRGLLGEALSLDRRLHSKLNTAESAAMLARTQLAQDMDAETLELLLGLKKDEFTPQTLALLGIALAREGKLDEAKIIARESTPPDDADAPLLCDYAALHAATGNTKAALDTLTMAFERTPPSQLEAAKAKARQCKDFGTLRNNAAFAKVLETQSKVAESKCSGGTGCGKCPNRAKCGMKSAGASGEHKPCGGK